MFTVRLSWPASTPVDFRISLHDPPASRRGPPIPPKAKGQIVDLENQKSDDWEHVETEKGLASSGLKFLLVEASNSRFKRAPVRDGGVLPFQTLIFPSWFLPAPDLNQATPQGELDGAIRFHIIVEPLVLGVLPESMLPAVALLISLIVLAQYFAVPRINEVLGRLADRVRKGKEKAE
ncbi:hypothetical protein FRC17_006718 [Serendipita sp. 399]|nr:hypothetical protein FRC17_006718 [Serendipita sp. 399]